MNSCVIIKSTLGAPKSKDPNVENARAWVDLDIHTTDYGFVFSWRQALTICWAGIKLGMFGKTSIGMRTRACIVDADSEPNGETKDALMWKVGFERRDRK